MKWIYHRFLSVSLLICLISCNKAESQNLVKFLQIVLLESKELILSDVYLKYPFRVRLQDSILYVMDIHSDAYYCHAFDYPSMRLRHSFAPKGEAPEEFLDVENTRSDSQGFLRALDANKRKMVRFSENPASLLNKTVNLDEKLIRTLDFDLLNDSTFIVPDYTGEYRINIINLQGEIIHRAFHIPAAKGIVKNTASIVLAQAWRPFLGYNSKHGILAMVTQLGQVLELYNVQDESIVKIVSHKNLEPQFITQGNYAIPNGIMGYSDIHVGEESIYALFWGSSFSDIKKGKVKEEGGNTVHVFTLDGTPKIEYKLDTHITGFHIDQKNKSIIGLDVNSNQPLKIFKYE